MNNWTYGCELELGDVLKSTVIPKELGSWEYSERDIVNVLAPYQNVAADPLGVNPPVGGEINVMPAKSFSEVLDKIDAIKTIFPNATVPCTSHFHIHIHVPGLKNDIYKLHALIKFIGENQQYFVSKTLDYSDNPLYKYTKGAKSYLKYDGGRLMPQYMIDNILNKSTNFDEFIKMHCAGKDGISMGRPFRYAINTYSLKHIDTVEFRCFRGSLDREELWCCFMACTNFLEKAVGLDLYNVPLIPPNAKFPKLKFDLDVWLGYEATKHPDSRGKKVRTFHELY